MQKVYNSFLNEEITVSKSGSELAADIAFIEDWMKTDNTIKDYGNKNIKAKARYGSSAE